MKMRVNWLLQDHTIIDYICSRMKYITLFLPLVIMMSLFHCNSEINVSSEVAVEKIPVGPGPEDMVLDSAGGVHRLIISCSARRDSHKPYGEILSYDLDNGSQAELIRYNEPDQVLFHPHGIYLDRDMLYVISHEKEPDYHPILVYRLHGDSLEFKELIHTADQHSPNALVTGPGGDLYFVNDSGKRGSLAEKIFKLKRASLVRLARAPQGEWNSTVVASHLGYPAGINRIGNSLYVGDAILNQIHVFQISGEELIPEKSVDNLTGVDNIRIYEGELLAPGHVKPFRFIKHTRDPGNRSPVDVFLANPVTGKTSIIYSTDGSAISAGSTAIIFENHLYICQIFDPFILRVPLDNQGLLHFSQGSRDNL